MKNNNRKRGGELFGMSFLDVICCGFGAMVLLVLLSKTDVAGGAINTDLVQNLLNNITADTSRKTSGEQQRETLTEQRRELEFKLAELADQAPDITKLNQRLQSERAKAKHLQQQLAEQTATREKLQAVGGIPVTAEYIIFIIDTSGSMDIIWEWVVAELENILDIHPDVKGFQIMNDNGTYLVGAYKGKWMSDTPGRRKSVLAKMQTWNSFSSSSPVEGLEVALRTYAKRTDKLSIYVFGDEYRGGSYDPVFDTLEKLNRDPKTGAPLAQIHGIGFVSTLPNVDYYPHVNTTARFATLMREVTRRFGGAFIGLSVLR